MKKIKIEINKAKITSFEVKLGEEYPDVCATISLYAGEKQVSSFSLRTESYYGNSLKFDLPISLIEPIKEIANKLEEILILKCSEAMGELPAPKL